MSHCTPPSNPFFVQVIQRKQILGIGFWDSCANQMSDGGVQGGNNNHYVIST
jgi:hypothetical protein